LWGTDPPAMDTSARPPISERGSTGSGWMEQPVTIRQHEDVGSPRIEDVVRALSILGPSQDYGFAARETGPPIMSAGGSVWDPNFDRVGVGGENPNGIIFGDVNPTTSPTLDGGRFDGLPEGLGLPPHIMGKKYYGDKEKDIKKEYGSKTGKRPIHADEARSNARWDGISDDAARRQLAFEREWESGQGETYAVGPDRSKQMYVEQQEAAYQDHQSTMRQKQTDYEQAWEDYHSPATRRSSLEDEYKELSNQLLGSGPKTGYTTDPWETVFTRALDDPQLAEMLGRLAMIGVELGLPPVGGQRNLAEMQDSYYDGTLPWGGGF